MKLLMHTCCAPCSVYCIDTLRKEGIEPTLYWYNPNIHPYKEYQARRDCLKTYAEKINIHAIFEDEYGLDEFCKNVANNLNSRCVDYCYPIRLRKTFEYAKEHGYDAVTTTLLYSIYQKHNYIKKLMEQYSKEYGIKFLYRDFRYGFWEGHDKAVEEGLYMQKYCGCVFSEEDAQLKRSGIKPNYPEDFDISQVKRAIVIKKEKENKEKCVEIFKGSGIDGKSISNNDLYVLYYKEIPVCISVVSKIDENTIEVKNIFTIEAYRGKGYAQKMLKYLANNYKQKYTKMLITVKAENIAFFVKNGFDKYLKQTNNVFYYYKVLR